MSLNLISNPVTTESGVTNNIFAGFLPVEFEFKREDLAISTIGAGINNNIQISTSIDLSSILSVGDSVYCYGLGISGEFTYDDSGVITSIDAVSVTIDVDFIENITSGYINYLQNYYVEMMLTNPSNSDVNILRYTLRDDGNSAGNIKIDLSIPKDKLYQVFEWDTDTVDEERIKFKPKYKQVYEDSAESYTLIDQEIILIYATEQPTLESFLCPFDYNYIYQGYNAGVTLCHSDSNNDELGLKITYDELDINQNDLVSGTVIKSLSSNEYGLIFIDFEKNTSVNANTKYIRFNASFVQLPDFQAGDFSSDFDIT